MSTFLDPNDGALTPSTLSTCSEEELSNVMCNEQSADDCFEGPEKTMEVCFVPGVGSSGGLRDLTRQQLDFLCEEAKCTILSKISSNYIDAYVLSESSLFVYKYRYIMKTCGTTTLLRCLDSLIKFADELGMSLWWVGYSRKNLNNPSAQHWPHSNFEDEITFLSSHPVLQARLNGSGHILGPVTGDHWFVYVADLNRDKLISPNSSLCETIPEIHVVPSVNLDNITVNLMMFDLHRETAEVFYMKEGCRTGEEMTARSGIKELVPGAAIDACAFTPCGYSMNSILHDAYSTIHVTPEPQCSYASFETNTTLPSYGSLIRNVLNVFRPKRFVITMFADESALAGLKELPTALRQYVVPRIGVYNRLSTSSTTVEADLSCKMACFVVDASSDRPISPEQLLEAPRRERGYTD